jgi:hypothetical protein
MVFVCVFRVLGVKWATTTQRWVSGSQEVQRLRCLEGRILQPTTACLSLMAILADDSTVQRRAVTGLYWVLISLAHMSASSYLDRCFKL